MRIGLGLGLNQQSGGAVDLGAAVQAILSGTAGFAFDPIVTNLFQDIGGATPVVNASDPVGRVNCQWGNAPPNWQQGTVGQQPLWDGSGIAYDGTDDYFPTFSALPLLSGVPGAFYCERVNVTSLAFIRVLVSFSTGLSATTPRFLPYVDTDGSIKLQTRRLDADATNVTPTSAGVITAGVAAVVSCQVDWAGAGLAKVWVNGALVASAAVTGTAANSEATASLRVRDAAALNAAPGSPFSGWTRRSVIAPYVPSDVNRAAIEAWVGAA